MDLYGNLYKDVSSATTSHERPAVWSAGSMRSRGYADIAHTVSRLSPSGEAEQGAQCHCPPLEAYKQGAASEFTLPEEDRRVIRQ